MADAALARLSGRAPGQAQPVTVHVVTGQSAPVSEVLGHGPIDARLIDQWLTRPGASATVRRHRATALGQLAAPAAPGSSARTFRGRLREHIVLREQTCRTPWCEAPIAQIDHAQPHAEGGQTDAVNGVGLCQRCNLTKNLPGHAAATALVGGRHTLIVTTPTGHQERSHAPPPLGWGTGPPELSPLEAALAQLCEAS